VDLLQREAWRFPTSGDLTQVASELRAREIQLARTLAPAPVRSGAGVASSPAPSKLDAAGLSRLQTLLGSIRDAELVGDYTQVSALCEQTADLTEAADPAFALRLRGKAEDFGALVALAEGVGGRLAGALSSNPVAAEDERGDAAKVIGFEGRGLRMLTSDGEASATWLELTPTAVAALAERARLEPEGWMGVGVHAYRVGDPERAEAALRRAVERDLDLLSAVSAIIQRGRGDRPDPRGYQLEKGQFVAVAAVEARKRGTQWARQLAQILGRGDVAKAANWLEERQAEGPEALDALVLALSTQRERLAEGLEKLPISKRIEHLSELRAQLDGARQHALDLIYDEVKYFYPFRASQTSVAREAEYWKVQEDVDARVAALRDLWEAKGPSVRVTPELSRALAALDWVDQSLLRLGHYPSEAERQGREAARELLQALPTKGVVTLQTFARSPEEKALFAEWAAVEAYSEQVMADFADGPRRQFRITNRYRRMFGHRPLAAHAQLFEAAQAHSDEMSTLGYFSHFSPTPGRETPYARMRAAGYTYGVSENIALNSSALGAHNAWLHSAGHHRNLLNPGHTEFGVGVGGKYYTQAFGRGLGYAGAPGFVEALAEARD
ncbi:MAG: CAP domain-containing protein, partial [Myxococcota bacterium]